RKNHYIHYCANSRIVGAARSLARIDSLYAHPLIENGIPHFLDVYVVSPYLDQKVYGTRNGFSIPQERDTTLITNSEEITFSDIEKELASQLATQYNKYVQEAQERNKREIIDYIHKEAPRYLRYAKNPE